jgi:glycosyltransferase involved in cell wall biosynthesis
VISFRRQYPAWLYPGETDKDTSQSPLTIAAQYLLDPLYPWTWLRTADLILEKAPDLVIFQWWTPFWAPAFAFLARRLKKAGVRIVFLVHNVMPHEPRLWDRFLGRLALSAGQDFIVQTEKESERLRLLFPQAKPAVTPHPIYAMFSNHLVAPEKAREKLNIPTDAKTLLAFGIVRPYKGLVFLLEALEILRKKGEDYHLIIAGEFWEPEQTYRSQMKSAGIEDLVHIYNYYIPNEEIPTFFAAANVFVAPYIDGTASGAVKMALGFGLPTILTRCIMDETLGQQTNIWVVNARDSEDLAAAVQNSFANYSENKEIACNDDWDRMVAVVESLHKENRKVSER